MPSSLQSEFQIGTLKLKNRIGVAPMTRISATREGETTEIMLRYYKSFAQGGFGFLMTEGVYTDQAHSQAYYHQSGIANEKQCASWRKITDAVHQAGSKIFIQLMHAGIQGQGNIYQNELIGPSPVQALGQKLSIYQGEGAYPLPRPMSQVEIRQVIQGFAEAAKRAQKAGFDGVEIHGANGYLLDNFLTDYQNQRRDEYGGSIKNRLRMMLETINAVCDAVGYDLVVGIRISQGKVSDYHHKWPGAEKDAEIIFSSLSNTKVHYIHVTEYDATKAAFLGSALSLSALAKTYARIPVIANGSLEAPEKAEQLVAKNEADLITLGKAALANHDWPKRAQSGKPIRDFNKGILQPTAHIKEEEIQCGCD